MKTMLGCSEKVVEDEEFIEPTVGTERHGFLSEPVSNKRCEKCLYFDRDLASDHPCGLCYESGDKYEWTERGEDTGPDEVDRKDYRVCEACT